MKKSIRSMPKDTKNKLLLFYPDTPMRDWMLRYERISYHELATNRTAKKQITGKSYERITQ